MSDIYWLCTFRLRPGDYDAFKAVVRPLVEMTQKESGCLAYEYSISTDRTAVHIIERYRTSEDVVSHVTKTFSQFAERFGALATVMSFDVYGTPNAKAREILDGFGAKYFTRFDGFTK